MLENTINIVRVVKGLLAKDTILLYILLEDIKNWEFSLHNLKK